MQRLALLSSRRTPPYWAVVGRRYDKCAFRIAWFRNSLNETETSLCLVTVYCFMCSVFQMAEKGKSKVQGAPQSQTAALPRHQEEEKTDKSKQAKIEQTYEKH